MNVFQCGSRSGVGITLIRYVSSDCRISRYGMLLTSYCSQGFFIQAKSVDDYNKAYDPNNPNTEEEIAVQNEWLSYILMVVGFFVLLVSLLFNVAYSSTFDINQYVPVQRANADFVRVRRMRDIVLAQAGESPA